MNVNNLVSTVVFFTAATAGFVTASAGTDETDMASVDRGKYLVQIAGCNDCHTPGYLLSGGEVDEKLWLTGDSFGWRGPWGTTYAPNLRLRLQYYTEDEWLVFAKEMKMRPPMPWYTVNIMKDQDLKDIYHYVRYMGPAGKPAPDYVPPDREPTTPYALFPSPPEK